MAGGINLPSNGVGVGPVMSAMQFQPMAQDPFTTMLKAYAIGQQGRGQGVETLINAIKAPLIEPSMRAQMNLHNAQASKEQSLADALRDAYFGAYSADNVSGTDGVGGDGSDISQYTNPSPNISNAGRGVDRREMGMQLLRAMTGQPSEFPSEREARDIRTYRTKENIKHGMDEERGTTATKTDRQSRTLGIASVEPILEELGALDVPPQVLLGDNPMNPANWYYADQQATYKAATGLAVDSLMNAYNLPKNIPVIETVKEIVGRGQFESMANYKTRVKNALHHLQEQQGIISSGGKSKPQAQQPKFVKMRGPDGGIYDVAEKDVEAALRSGGSYE